jgi:hypothetical protein
MKEKKYTAEDIVNDWAKLNHRQKLFRLKQAKTYPKALVDLAIECPYPKMARWLAHDKGLKAEEIQRALMAEPASAPFSKSALLASPHFSWQEKGFLEYLIKIAKQIPKSDKEWSEPFFRKASMDFYVSLSLMTNETLSVLAEDEDERVRAAAAFILPEMSHSNLSKSNFFDIVKQLMADDVGYVRTLTIGGAVHLSWPKESGHPFAHFDVKKWCGFYEEARSLERGFLFFVLKHWNKEKVAEAFAQIKGGMSSWDRLAFLESLDSKNLSKPIFDWADKINIEEGNTFFFVSFYERAGAARLNWAKERVFPFWRDQIRKGEWSDCLSALSGLSDGGALKSAFINECKAEIGLWLNSENFTQLKEMKYKQSSLYSGQIFLSENILQALNQVFEDYEIQKMRALSDRSKLISNTGLGENEEISQRNKRFL